MSGDRIVAIVAIVAMLILVVPRVAQRGLGTGRVLRLTIVWVVIFLAATAIVLVVKPAGI